MSVPAEISCPTRIGFIPVSQTQSARRPSMAGDGASFLPLGAPTNVLGAAEFSLAAGFSQYTAANTANTDAATKSWRDGANTFCTGCEGCNSTGFVRASNVKPSNTERMLARRLA